MSEVELSVVVPMFDEQEVIPLFVERLRPLAAGWGCTYEVVCVDDGSRDATPVLLQRLRREWPELRVVRLRANAGHQAAISAGLARARGRYVVTIDADLQDPPETIGRMLEVAREEDVDVVYGVRSDRSTDSAFKRVTARAFYRSIRALSDVDAHVDAGDFRLMSRATVDAVNALPEHDRVLRLVVPALGFPSASVDYRREPRAAGESKYPLARMLRLSVDGVTGFSIAPLRFATWLGLLGGVAAIVVLVYAVVAMLLGDTLPGWTSTVVIVSAVGAVQLLALGILGEYVGRTYTALQARPTYFVAHDSLVDAGTAPTVPARPHVVPVRTVPEDGSDDDLAPTADEPPPARGAGGFRA
ncbi:glycosyltransferase family 2 protein [Phycicoccus flavus]|uniref:glycosyltransferase family 2 protein n=1 Tax=Phycicoccus flavus TaxID=2502783 RepID=UPI000FEBAE82|nr:glycosyltransferase family 2 protein [Phycicoccus flavus]NHA68905.1 glycosyltransferase family 2 protein [Phycicoccus flavus]